MINTVESTECLSLILYMANTTAIKQCLSKIQRKEKKRNKKGIIPRRNCLKQPNEINSCERINEMEECLRIDCFESAISFVLCYNFDRRNIPEKNNDRM